MNQQDQGTENQPARKPSSGLGTAIGVLVLLFVFAAYAYSRTQRVEPQPSIPVPENSGTVQRGASPTAPSATSTTEPTVSEKTFTVKGSNFTFSPLEIRVKRGDQVKVVFVNEEGFHDWVLDEFNARTPQIGAGATAEVRFTADKVGTFEYYCSVGSHRAMGMVGKLVVE